MSMIGFAGMIGTAAAVSAGVAPVNTVPPSIDNTTPSVGSVINASNGTWTGAVTVTGKWVRASTDIPWGIFNRLKVPANAATEALKWVVTATSAHGTQTTVESAPTAAVARVYADATEIANSAGIFSWCLAVVPGFVGNMVTLIFNGNTRSFGPTAKGLLDWYNPSPTLGVIAWWIANGGGDYNGLMPRIVDVPNQGPNNTSAKLINVTANLRPIVNLNNIRADGLCPISINAYNARGTDTSGTALAVSEDNTFLYVSNSLLPYDSSNISAMMIVEGPSNVGTGAINSPSQQVSMLGIKGNAGTPSNDNVTINVGNATSTGPNFASTSKIGVGITHGLNNVQVPAAPMLISNTRCLVTACMTNLTGNTIDGLTPSGTNVVSNICINNDPAQSWTVASAVTRTANSGATNGIMVGRSGENRAATGTGFGFYALIVKNGSLVTGNTGSIVDRRSVANTALMNVFGIDPTPVTTVVTVIGASSGLQYAGDAGSGFTAVMQQLLGPKVQINVVALAGARNVSDLKPNAAYLASALKVAGKRNIPLIYCASSDIGGAGNDGPTTWADQCVLVDALVSDGGWYQPCVSTFVLPSYSGDATKRQNNLDYNNLVTSAAQKTLHGHMSTDPASISQLQSPSLPLYFDGTPGTASHVRSSNGHALMAAVMAATLAPHIA